MMGQFSMNEILSFGGGYVGSHLYPVKDLINRDIIGAKQ